MRARLEQFDTEILNFLQLISLNSSCFCCDVLTLRCGVMKIELSIFNYVSRDSPNGKFLNSRKREGKEKKMLGWTLKKLQLLFLE